MINLQVSQINTYLCCRIKFKPNHFLLSLLLRQSKFDVDNCDSAPVPRLHPPILDLFSFRSNHYTANQSR